MPNFREGDIQFTYKSKRRRKVTRTYHSRAAAARSRAALRKLGVSVSVSRYHPGVW